MSSEEQDEERRNSDQKKRGLPKRQRSSSLTPDDLRIIEQERELNEQLKALKMAKKERSLSSTTFKTDLKLPDIDTESEYESEFKGKKEKEEQPHTTQPLKAQLLDIIERMSPKGSAKSKPQQTTSTNSDLIISTEERDEAERKMSQQRRTSTERREAQRSEEEYNRMKRIEFLIKHRNSSYTGLNPTEKQEMLEQEKELNEQLRAVRLSIKERRKSSDPSADNKLPKFVVRRKSTLSNAPVEAEDNTNRKSSGLTTTYYPHQGVRRSIISDIAKGGSRRATEPLKAQLMEIIGRMSLEERAKLSRTSDLGRVVIRSGSGLPTIDQPQAGPSSRSPAVTSQPSKAPPKVEVAPYKLDNEDAGPSTYVEREEDTATSARATVMSTPTLRTQPKTAFLDCSCDFTDETNTFVTKDPDSLVSSSVAANTIRLPSTSSAMREGRTKEFLNGGWYQNVYYNETNDEFSSVMESSARQMNIPPQFQQQYMQNVQNIQNMQHMATAGPIICDRCLYGNEDACKNSQPCCPTLTQAMSKMDPAVQQAMRTANTIQCDDVCPTRNSFLRTIYNAFRNRIDRRLNIPHPFDPTISDLYRLKISEASDRQGHPKRVIFDLIDDGMYNRPTAVNVGTNTQGIGNPSIVAQMGIVQPGGSSRLLFNPPPQQSTFVNEQGTYNTGAIVINHPQGDQSSKSPSKIAVLKQNLRRHQERIDVYYFDHGNASYYRTTDSPGTIYTELIAERAEHSTAQYWAELFGTIHIAFALFTAFFLQLYRFVLQSTCRPLTVGVVQLTSDYLFKPALALLFNAIVQPILIYLYNIATSFRDLCEPIADAFGYFLRELAVPIRAFRLVEVRQHKHLRPQPQMM